MSFTAQDFWRKRKRSSSLSFFLNVLILLFLLISGISGVLQAEEKALLEFTDNDSRGGWLSGDLIFTVPESISSTEKSAKISKYVLRWGNNPHQRLGMFLPIVSLRPTESGRRKQQMVGLFAKSFYCSRISDTRLQYFQ